MWISNPINARKVVNPAADAAAFRPARIRRAGKTAPRKGRAAIRNRDKCDTPVCAVNMTELLGIIY
jgi:hypothetical protein